MTCKTTCRRYIHRLGERELEGISHSLMYFFQSGRLIRLSLLLKLALILIQPAINMIMELHLHGSEMPSHILTYDLCYGGARSLLSRSPWRAVFRSILPKHLNSAQHDLCLNVGSYGVLNGHRTLNNMHRARVVLKGGLSFQASRLISDGVLYPFYQPHSTPFPFPSPTSKVCVNIHKSAQSVRAPISLLLPT